MTKEGRQYRAAMPFTAVDDKDTYIVEGYATTFDMPYELYDGLYEVIDRNAISEADMKDVIFQYDHHGQVFARNRNSTLELKIDDHGLFVRADLSGSQGGRELYEAIKSGLIDRMSWGFTVDPDGWEYDAETKTSTITKVRKVFDVSAVSIPANDFTDIKARSYLNGVIEALEQQELLQSQEAEKRERLALALEITTKGHINVSEMDGRRVPFCGA